MLTRKQWGKDRPPTGQFDGYSPQQPQTPSFPQASPGYGFPQYGGGPGAMTPQGAPQSANSANSMPAYPPSHQSPMGGPSPGARNWTQPPGSYGGPGMTPQGYGGVQMPASAGGYGRTDQNPSAGWGPQSAGAFPSNPPSNSFGVGYQG